MTKLFLPLILLTSTVLNAAPSTSPQITAQTIRTGASSVVTLPTTNGTLCGIAESCSLTNKVNIASTSATIGTLSISGNVGIAGTVVSGNWAGVAIPATNGGTGLTSGTSGGVPYFGTTSTIASSGALTANRIVLGGGAGAAPTVAASLGTTSTLLHGNASGAPTYSAVSLTADVTGNLPVANGGLAANQVVSAIINSGTAVGAQLGGTWIASVTTNSTGDGTLNLTGSFFSGVPECTCTVINDSNPNSRICKLRTTSSSTIRVFTGTYLDVASAETYHIICMGAR